MALSISSKAPLFTLKSKNAEGLQDINLSDYIEKGNTVLLFFPFAFTGVCTDEMCSASQMLEDFDKLDAQVFGISVDSPFSQEVFAQQNSIGFPLLSDFGGHVAKMFDVLYEEFVGLKHVAKRAAFVINKDGDIAYSWSTEDPKVLPNFDAIKAALK